MFSPDQYELLDFGAGRKLERFGQFVLDRATPSAEGYQLVEPALWNSAHHRFLRDGGGWRFQNPQPPCWTVQHGPLSFQLTPSEAGQIGLFPEQASNWDWLSQQIAVSATPCKVLNLFAYTGGSTLAAAAAGAEVVHIDAASSVVERARRNAELSGLADRPIRWITEDAVKFVDRELRRGNRYNAVILDPPSYGHGTSGRAWKLAQDLPPLLEKLAQLTIDHRAFVLLTCHTPGFDAAALAALLKTTLGRGAIEHGALALQASTGRSLPSGHYARWTPRS